MDKELRQVNAKAQFLEMLVDDLHDADVIDDDRRGEYVETAREMLGLSPIRTEEQ